MRNLFTCVIRAKKNITSWKTIYVISDYIPDWTEGFCVMDFEKGVKFRKLYPRRFFFFPSLTVGRDWNFLISGLLCPYLGVLVLTLSIGWEPRSLANAGLFPWRYILLPSDLVKSDHTICWNTFLWGILLKTANENVLTCYSQVILLSVLWQKGFHLPSMFLVEPYCLLQVADFGGHQSSFDLI